MNIDQEKIRRFISDKFSFSDYLFVSSCFEKEKKEEKLHEFMDVDWNQTSSSSDGERTERLSYLLDKLHHEININHKERLGFVKYSYRIFSRVASVLIIPAIITIAVLFYWSNRTTEDVGSWTEIHSPLGSRTKFQLPDGTQGWLNGGSSIRYYPQDFRKHRDVEISGEAWFDVPHLNAQCFRVITPSFDVKVLGTRFNIVAYDDDKNVQVILERGKVQILGKKDGLVKGELDPDEQIIYDKNSKKISKTGIDAKSYTSWKDGLLIFKNIPMSEIARRLEHKYNVDIILHGDSLKSSIFRATFQDENLDEICKMLSTVAPIEYKILKREKQADNTFEKNKVEMWLK
jgi:transmembrane sensor